MTVKPATPFDGVAWITGASSGLGYSSALQLVKKGWRVAVTARSKDSLEALQEAAKHEYGEVIVMEGDVGDKTRMAEIIDTLEKEHGGIALAVLNAGIYQPVHGNQLDLETFEKSISVNVFGTLNCLVPLSHVMGARGRGQIVFVSSVAGYGGLPTSAAYGATKAALINLASSLKFDFEKMGILIQVVSPGFVDTPATRSNPFPMPFLMDVEDAAARLVAGLEKRSFETTFPRRFTYSLKLINLLPHWLYFPVVAAFTAWKKRPLEKSGTLPGQSEEPGKHW